MKNGLLMLLLLCACTPKLPHLNNGISRNDRLDYDLPDRKDSSVIPTPLPGTTCVWISGVEYPADYDWRGDILRDDVPAEVFLLCDGKKVFSMPAKPSRKISTEPNKHHFMKDAMFSEYCDTSGTYLLRNGKILAHFEGQWSLAGLLVRDGKVHSLWRSQRGKEIMLAEDDGAVMTRSAATAIGSLTGAPFWPTGALYESKERICFDYIHEESGFHVVRDLNDEQVWQDANTERIFDVRVIDGKTTAIYSRKSGGIFVRHGASEMCISGLTEAKCIGLKDIMLFENGGSPWLMCRYRLNDALEYFSVWDEDHMVAMQLYQGHTYVDRGQVTLLSQSRTGGLCFMGPDGSMVDIDTRSYWFSWRCACVHKGRHYICLTPREKGKPSIWVDGDITELPVNGFVTGIYVVDY